MASPHSGTTTSSGSSLLQNSVFSEEDLMEQRKRKRKISNRESARRSRMRKQQQVDDLTAEVARLRRENDRIMTNLSATTHHCLRIEGENLILRAQAEELSHRLESLIQIISFLNGGNGGFGNGGSGGSGIEEHFYGATHDCIDGFVNNPWNYVGMNQPIMAIAEMLQY